MEKELIEKYNIPVPRYTSYPPANYFESFSKEDYLTAVEESNHSHADNISFYLHMPFCRRLCHYCGCNSYVMGDEKTVNDYIASLHKEIDMVAKHFDPKRSISQIHYGGGSPTAMPVKVLKELNDHMLSLFPTIEKPEIAVECHPGFLSHEDWQGLVDSGFNRFSIGVQDFDEQVLKAVNRQPSLLPMEEIFSILRTAGASINMDFLYGLPYQSPESFRAAIEKAMTLRPDRLVTFSYGHVPWVFKRQQVLEKLGLPDGDAKSRMFSAAIEVMERNGYQPIGMDHFVLPEDELYQALANKQLHRNFQGYCTRRTTGQVYAFGVTGISQLDTAYAQSGKNIQEYIDHIQQGELYICKGYRLNEQERKVREVIECLMCNYHISWKQLADDLHLTPEELKNAVNYDRQKLEEMAKDGIINFSDEQLEMTKKGKSFVRNVAAVLDPLMLHTTKKYSKPI